MVHKVIKFRYRENLIRKRTSIGAHKSKSSSEFAGYTKLMVTCFSNFGRGKVCVPGIL